MSLLRVHHRVPGVKGRYWERRKIEWISTLVVFVALVMGTDSSPMPPSHNDGQTRGEWGDQGDGTYANPLIPADFSDLDAIRVGEDYYAISSTLQYSPGMIVLHSKDLVNWEAVGHVVDDLTLIDPELNWNKMSRPGRGIWAGSIRHHAGKFWVYFGTPDQGYFVSSAADPAGPWKPVKLVFRAAGWDDPCPFWDDDGQGYLIGTHFAPEAPSGSTYNVHLFKLSSDGEGLVREWDRIIHRSNGSEANKLYKINGSYYHLYSEIAVEGRVVMIGRARSLNGPWETKQLQHVNPGVDKEPNQGGLVQLPDGRWYFLSHQGTGDWEGRACVLLPVTWIDGWPIVGGVGSDGLGKMVWRGVKPVKGFPRTNIAASDDFVESKLKPSWEWNYQPRSGKWSLAERPGFLRLYAFPPLAREFKGIGNVVTQRCFRTRHSQVTVTLDLTGLVSGQEAGLAHFAKTYCTLSAVQTGPQRRLTFNNNGQRTSGPVISAPMVWLRSDWDFDGFANFSYSEDGRLFRPLGGRTRLTWGAYRGDRIGIFTVNSNGTKGYLDVDSFQYEVER